MNFRDRALAISAFPLAMLFVALVFLGSDAGQLAQRFRGILFDAYQHAQPRSYEDTLPRAGFSVRVLESDARFSQQIKEIVQEQVEAGKTLEVVAGF